MQDGCARRPDREGIAPARRARANATRVGENGVLIGEGTSRFAQRATALLSRLVSARAGLVAAFQERNATRYIDLDRVVVGDDRPVAWRRAWRQKARRAQSVE